MEISPEQLDAFRAIYRAKFDVELTPQEALEKAIALLTLMKAVYQPMTENDMAQVRERKSHLMNQQ